MDLSAVLGYVGAAAAAAAAAAAQCTQVTVQPDQWHCKNGDCKLIVEDRLTGRLQGITMQQHEGSLSKGRFSPRGSVCSAYIGQVDSLLILPCPQKVFGLLIQCNRLEQHYLHTSKP